MSHLILTGATGLVGSATLAHMLTLAGSGGPISRLTILSRRAVPMAEGREGVSVLVHDDFEKYSDDLLTKLKGAEGCVWALGISQTQVSKEAYEKITVEYPLAAAKAFSSLNERFKFVYVSGEGATTEPGKTTAFFGRVKGQAERQLLDLAKTNPSLKPFSVRPGMVDSTNHAEVEEANKGRNIPIWQSLLFKVLRPAIRTLYPSGTSPTKELGKFLTDLAMGNGEPFKDDDIQEGRIIPNKVIRRLSSSSK